MSRLAIGTVQFGLPYGIYNHTGKVSPIEVQSILNLALSHGINTLDTAIAYGDSESCLGNLGVGDFKVVTKLPAFIDNCHDVREWVHQQVNASLSRLRVKSIYGLLLHRPEQLLHPKGVELYKALQELKDKGQVQKVGISIYSPNELYALIPRYRFDLVQSPFNLIDQRLFTSGWLGRLKDFDIEIHTRSVFLQGLLLMLKAEIPYKFSPWQGLWDIWHQWLLDYNIPAIDACLAFPLSFSDIDHVIVGSDNTKQLLQITNAAKSQLNKELPNLKCEDENLINPSNWKML